MKKIIALILATIMLMSLVGCDYLKNNDDTTPPEQVKIRIGYMAGPTGMGMAKLIHDNGGLDSGNEKYSFTKYADTNAAKADLAAGNIDIICLPTNEAAMYQSKVDKDAKVLAINCLNSLYYVSAEGLSDTNEFSLAKLEGKTIYTCKNGTPRIVLQYILSVAGINATVSYAVDDKEILTPADLSALVISGSIPNAVMPEPLASTSVFKTMTSSDTSKIYSVKIDLGDEWDKICDTPMTMGCVIADGDFARDYSSAVNQFLTEYEASVSYIANPDNIESAANYVVETGVIGNVALAKMALNNLGSSITYIDGEDMKNALINFYNAIEVTLPDDSFYYEK